MKLFQIINTTFIFLLFTGMIIHTAIGTTPLQQINPQPLANTLYVGGNGPGNYTTIQAAIDNATNGDTIYVFNGTYYEHISISKQLILTGEHHTTTIIDGNHTDDVLTITANQVTITGFTIQKSGEATMADAGIEIISNNVTITNNTIRANGWFGIFLNTSQFSTITNNTIHLNGQEGIFLDNCKNNDIKNNHLHNNIHCGLVLRNSTNNNIYKNDMHHNYCSMSLWPQSNQNHISYNLFHDHPGCGIGIWDNANLNIIDHNQFYNNKKWGLVLTHTGGNLILQNTISNNTLGLRINRGAFNIITHNNFINNNHSAIFENSTLNRWIRNYWDDRIIFLPKIIHGTALNLWDTTKSYPWINIDFFPTKKPFQL